MRERRDGCGWHAVAHAMEMQNRTAGGIAWLRADTDDWSRESFFAAHHWWHLALYHFDRGEIDEVLHFFGGQLHGARSTVVLDMIDATAAFAREVGLDAARAIPRPSASNNTKRR